MPNSYLMMIWLVYEVWRVILLFIFILSLHRSWNFNFPLWMRLRIGMNFLFAFEWKRLNGFSLVLASMKLHNIFFIFYSPPPFPFVFLGFYSDGKDGAIHWMLQAQDQLLCGALCAECSFICVNLWRTQMSARSQTAVHCCCFVRVLF